MILKPPTLKTGKNGLQNFKIAIELHQTSLTNRFDREFHRKELARWQKLYATLAKKRPSGSIESVHFNNVSKICGEMLEIYGPEPSPKKRAPKVFTPTTLKYPEFPTDITHKLHFIEGPGLRRQRAIKLSESAPFVFRQTSGKGRVLVSIGTSIENIRYYERLVATLSGLLGGDLSKAGFDIGYIMRPVDTADGAAWRPNYLNPELPIAQIWHDNDKANGYTWQARALGDHYLGRDGEGLPTDITKAQIDEPWDPDPIWDKVIKLTGDNRVREALAIVDSIPGIDREILYDEVIYLRFLNGSYIFADDVRHLARKYVSTSVISSRLIDEFENFIECLQKSFDEDAPMIDQLSRLKPDFGSSMMPPMPPASDWAALQKHQELFANPIHPRGRIFPFNIGISPGNIEGMLAAYMVDAEDMFRRERSIPEIGKGWASEVALFDLVRTVWPSAIHQWRPAYLGRQSVDIFIPEIQLAIEYQGQQHYEPVALFGGDDGLKATQVRDERKRSLLASNNIPLIEWPYHVAITLEELNRFVFALGLKVPD